MAKGHLRTIRVPPDTWRAYQLAAKAAGSPSLSEWIRATLDTAVLVILQAPPARRRSEIGNATAPTLQVEELALDVDHQIAKNEYAEYGS